MCLGFEQIHSTLHRCLIVKCIQCSSDISEPKYTRNLRQPNTHICVCIYAHTRIQIWAYASLVCIILVPRGRAPFGQHQESRPLAKSGSPRFTDFPSLCTCSESSLTNLIGSDLNLLCLQSHSKTECRWTRPEVAILGADQKERGLWGRECGM